MHKDLLIKKHEISFINKLDNFMQTLYTHALRIFSSREKSKKKS